MRLKRGIWTSDRESKSIVSTREVTFSYRELKEAWAAEGTDMRKGIRVWTEAPKILIAFDDGSDGRKFAGRNHII